jgi:hypothetical protein
MFTKKEILLVLGLLILQVGYSQMIIRQSLNCTGTSIQASNILLKQTVGQSSNTGTINSNGFIIKQGFLQGVNRQDELLFNKNEDIVSVYPNPADKYFYVHLNEKSNSVYRITVLDMFGRIVLKDFMLSELKTTIDCDLWSSGVYLVIVHNNQEILTKQKIIKTS